MYKNHVNHGSNHYKFIKFFSYTPLFCLIKYFLQTILFPSNYIIFYCIKLMPIPTNLLPCLVGGKVKLERKMIPEKMNPGNMIPNNFTFQCLENIKI